MSSSATVFTCVFSRLRVTFHFFFQDSVYSESDTSTDVPILEHLRSRKAVALTGAASDLNAVPAVSPSPFSPSPHAASLGPKQLAIDPSAAHAQVDPKGAAPRRLSSDLIGYSYHVGSLLADDGTASGQFLSGARAALYGLHSSIQFSHAQQWRRGHTVIMCTVTLVLFLVCWLLSLPVRYFVDSPYLAPSALFWYISTMLPLLALTVVRYVFSMDQPFLAGVQLSDPQVAQYITSLPAMSLTSRIRISLIHTAKALGKIMLLQFVYLFPSVSVVAVPVGFFLLTRHISISMLFRLLLLVLVMVVMFFAPHVVWPIFVALGMLWRELGRHFTTAVPWLGPAMGSLFALASCAFPVFRPVAKAALQWHVATVSLTTELLDTYLSRIPEHKQQFVELHRWTLLGFGLVIDVLLMIPFAMAPLWADVHSSAGQLLGHLLKQDGAEQHAEEEGSKVG